MKICNENRSRATLPVEAAPICATRRAAGDGEAMNSHFSIALLPDLIVLLGVGGAALEAATAMPTQELRWIILWLRRTCRVASS